jgi:hypothetical protein
MKADTQFGHAVGAANCIRRCGRADHQACCAQNAGAMRNLDRFVDLDGQTKIICRDDQVVQCACSLCCRRNWMNSTLSRRRRFITCGLRIISHAMAAIFGARK